MPAHLSSLNPDAFVLFPLEVFAEMAAQPLDLRRIVDVYRRAYAAARAAARPSLLDQLRPRWN